jgi:hypothetical protein
MFPVIGVKWTVMMHCYEGVYWGTLVDKLQVRRGTVGSDDEDFVSVLGYMEASRTIIVSALSLMAGNACASSSPASRVQESIALWPGFDPDHHLYGLLHTNLLVVITRLTGLGFHKSSNLAIFSFAR